MPNSDRFGDGGTDLGGTFSEVAPNPRRKAEEAYTKEQAERLHAALADPTRRVTAGDVLVDGAILSKRTMDIVTPRGPRQQEEATRLRIESEERIRESVRAEARQASTDIERAEMEAYLASDEYEEDKAAQQAEDEFLEENGWGETVETSGF